MKSSKCDYLNSKVFQISELHEVNSLSPLSSDNVLTEGLLDNKKDEIKSEVLFHPSGDCTISSSSSLVLENVSSAECSQLLNESSDNQVIMVSDFLPSQVLLTDSHGLNSVPFNPVTFLNDNSTTVTWCNDSVSSLAGSQTGLYSHLINGQKIIQNDRCVNGGTFDIMPDCAKANKTEGSEATGSKFESNLDSLQPIILITTLSSSNIVPNKGNITSKSKSAGKNVKDKAIKKKSNVRTTEFKKNSFKMKAESSSSDECLSTVPDSNMMNLSHNNEILNSLLLNGDNLSTLFPGSSTLQTVDLSNTIQIDLSNPNLNLDSFESSKMDGKKFVFKSIDCNSALIDPNNFNINGSASPQSGGNIAKAKSNFANGLELGVYMNSNMDHCSGDSCISSRNAKSISPAVSKNNDWSIKIKQKESLTNDKTIFSNLPSSSSNRSLDPSDAFLTSINLNESAKCTNSSTLDMFDDKIQSASATLGMSTAKIKNSHETEMGNMELNGLQLGSSPPGYTAQLLSQLSHDHSLPSISSSQVSSVLSALEQNEKQLCPGEMTFSQMVNSNETLIKNENINENDDEDVKVVDGSDENSDFKLKNKAKLSSQKVQLVKCELNGYACYKCGLCPYLSMSQEAVINHFQQHQSKLLRRAIRCIGCKNQFYSKFLLKAHLLQDHEVLVDELHPILDAVLAANKPQAMACKRKQSKFSLITESLSSKEPEISLSPMAPTISMTSNTISSAPNLVKVPSASQPIQEQFIPLNAATFEPVVEPLPVTIPMEVSRVPTHTALSAEFSESITMNIDLTESIKMNGELAENMEMNVDVDVDSKLQSESAVQGDEKSDCDKKKIKKTKVRPIAINKLLNQQKDGTTPETPPASDTVPVKSKKNSDNGVKCGLEGCSSRFTDMNNLDFHQRCHDLENSTFKCPDCDHTNPDWSRFSLHLWRSHNINIELYSCGLCNYKTSSRSQLHNLHYRIHGDERPFLCDLCGKGFKTTKQLRNHKAIHRLKAISKTETKEILCNTCGCSFADSRKLQLHENNIHKKLRPFLCNYCGHKASSRSSLRMHIRQHTGEKPFSCEECDYVTGDHNSMRRHKMRHSGAKRYSCPHCSYACIQSNTYKSHLKRKHPGLDEGLMFCCPLCSFVSVKKENLMSHMMEHKDSENENERDIARRNGILSENGHEIEIINEIKNERMIPIISHVKSLSPDFNLENVTVIDVLPSDQTLVLQGLDKDPPVSLLQSNNLVSLINEAELVIDVKDSIRSNGFHEPPWVPGKDCPCQGIVDNACELILHLWTRRDEIAGIDQSHRFKWRHMTDFESFEGWRVIQSEMNDFNDFKTVTRRCLNQWE